MSAISTWSTTAASNNSAAPDGWPEGMPPSAVNNAAREMMASIRTQHENKGWADLGHTVTYLSATTFKIATDVTAQYSVNRRIRCTDSGTLYGRVSASSYGAPDTTVTVVLDSGSLSVALSAVALGPEANVFPTVLTGDLTVGGAFTSLGIDDNCTVENLQMSDTALTIGPQAGGAISQIVRPTTDGSFGISGGGATTTGGNIFFYGGTHATRADDHVIRAGTNVVTTWDESAGHYSINTGIGAKTQALRLDASLVAAFAGEVTGTGFTATGDVTGSTMAATGDTAAGDNASMGYTAAEGLILTGQGSTNDVTIKNDADADVLEIPTGTTNVSVVGNLSGAEIQVAGTDIFETIYPVGSVYVNKSVATNPGTLFGVGTWVAIEDAFLIGASATYAAESTGGNKDAIIPNHTHPIGVDTDESGPATVIVAGSGPESTTLPTDNPTGGASVTNANLPPYVAVYMWERVS